MLPQKAIEALNTPLNLHGEGPIWHSGRQSAFWVDILSDTIFEFCWNKNHVNTYPNAKFVSAIFEIESQNDSLICSVKGGLGIYYLYDKECRIFNDLGIDWQERRGNDGAIDPLGNIWFSTTHIDHLDGDGNLYCLLPDGEIKKMVERVSISNGPSWSPDGKTMFHTDSGSRSIKRYFQNQWQLTETIRPIHIAEDFGYPDGMAMDVNGILWVAIWGGFAVGGYDIKTSRLVHKITVPVPHVSSCAFVGSNLDYLLITTSRKGLSQEDLLKYPESGRTFLVQMDTKGVQMRAFSKKF